MPVIAVLSGSYCHGDQIASLVAEKLDCPLEGGELLDDAAREFGTSRSSLEKTLRGETSFFNNMTHEKEKNLIFLKAALAKRLNTMDMVLHSKLALLITKAITHVLRVSIIADHSYRVNRLIKVKKISQKSAEKIINNDDLNWRKWGYLLHHKSLRAHSLSDLNIPSGSVNGEEAVELILENAGKAALNPTAESVQATVDFILATRINAELAKANHYYCEVSSSLGDVTITINRNVIRLESLVSELKNLAVKIDGVKRVAAKAGPGYNQPDIAMKFDFEVPVEKLRHILLVDDEQEYVTTLSERLNMRDFTSDVALNGEEALSYIKENEPRVIVLDLRMPGIDGVEVLRRVKRDFPKIQVIVLTGHGTEKDKKLVLDMGAFAYLEKPVSIDDLAKTLRNAEGMAKQIRAEETGNQ